MSLGETLSDKRIVAFLVFWLALNAYFGLSPMRIAGEEGGIAWEAHIGGFLCGLLIFGAFDQGRPPRRVRALAVAARNFPATCPVSCASSRSRTECRSRRG